MESQFFIYFDLLKYIKIRMESQFFKISIY